MSLESVLLYTKFDINNIDDVIFMTSPNICTTHAFTTRFGGVSDGIYESLNLAQKAGDDFERVAENYSRLCKALGIKTDSIVCSTQVHGTDIRIVKSSDCGKLLQDNPHKSDGLITQTPGIALMVFTADCVPILLFDPIKNAAAAVHAGWRGTAANIAGEAVSKLKENFGCSPADIKAAIGPCISKCCFETDSDVPDALTDALGHSAADCYTQNVNKYMVDLKNANAIFLKQAGLTDISISDECTSCSSDKYWSHRKTKGKRGTQAALIVLNS